MIRKEREAAIAYIKGYRKLDEDLHNTAPKDSISYYATDKCLKYWDMAISALELQEKAKEAWDSMMEITQIATDVLEQKPCETSTDEPMTMVYPTIFCDDAISRELAISTIYDKYIGMEHSRIMMNTAIECMEILKELPSVQPSRKGHWIAHSDGGIWIKYYECSECRGRYDTQTNFCPNCGCRRVGDAE